MDPRQLKQKAKKHEWPYIKGNSPIKQKEFGGRFNRYAWTTKSSYKPAKLS